MLSLNPLPVRSEHPAIRQALLPATAHSLIGSSPLAISMAFCPLPDRHFVAIKDVIGNMLGVIVREPPSLDMLVDVYIRSRTSRIVTHQFLALDWEFFAPVQSFCHGDVNLRFLVQFVTAKHNRVN